MARTIGKESLNHDHRKGTLHQYRVPAEPAGQHAAAGAVSAPGGAEPDISPVDGTDRVHLSDPGLNLLPEQTQETDPARAERVQAIKQAIEEKRYHIESRKIADRLLQEASELLGTLTGYPEDPFEKEAAASESGQPGEKPEFPEGKAAQTQNTYGNPARTTRSFQA